MAEEVKNIWLTIGTNLGAMLLVLILTMTKKNTVSWWEKKEPVPLFYNLSFRKTMKLK